MSLAGSGMVHHEAAEPEIAETADPARGPTVDRPAEGLTNRDSLRPSAVLWLQGSAGNGAVSRLVESSSGPGVLVQRAPPTLDAPAADPAVEKQRAAEQALRPAIERVLNDASTQVGLEFAVKLAAAVSAALTMVEAADRTRAEEAAKKIAALSVPVDSGGVYDIPLLLIALDGLHRDATGQAGVVVSAGLRQVVRVLGGHATTALLDVLAGSTLYTADLENDVHSAVEAVTDGTALLRLELEGTIAELITLRTTFASATDDTARAQAGTAIGATARSALLLDEALRKATKPGGPSPLDAAVEQRAADIARIHQTAATEKATKSAMDDRLTLLAEQRVTIAQDATDPGSVTPLGEESETAVQPEEAFPETTDSAEHDFTGELGTRIGQQRTELKDLRGRVLPEHPTYELDEYVGVHRRWFSLYSAEQEKQDPIVKMMLELMGEPYRMAGADVGGPGLKIEGGIARAYLMNMAVEAMSNSMHGETNQFGAQLDAGGPKRTVTTSGTASSPEFQYGELYPNGTPKDRSRAGEVASRKEFQDNRQLTTAAGAIAVAALPAPMQPAAATRVGLTSGPELPIVGARATNPKEGWTYLTDVYSMDRETIVVREQKVVPPEVAEYLLAARQQAQTLARTHVPTADGRPLGSRAMRAQGVEAAGGASAARYLQGQASPAADRNAAALQAQLAAARKESGVDPDHKPPDAVALTGKLRGDLGDYLETFFAERQSLEYRLAAIFVIGDIEHGVGSKLMNLLEPKALATMVAEAVKVSAIMVILQAMGPLGTIAAHGYAAYLATQGISDVAALISIAAFCRNAASADSLSKARAWGYMTVNLTEDAEQLLTTLVATPVTAGLHALTAKKPTTPTELADAVRPLMADPAAREALLREVEADIAKIEETGSSTPELASLKAFRDGLLQRSTIEGSPAADTALPGSTTPNPEHEALFTKGRGRSEADLTALRNALGTGIDLVESPTLTGDAVHVRYAEDGKVRVEIGPTAEPAHLRQHLETVHQLRKYEGIVGRIRQLLSKLSQLITGDPAYGTEGFEARLEVQKLRGIESDLQAQLRAIESQADRLTGQDGIDLAREADGVRLQLESIQKQLAEHEANVDSYATGRGFVAAEDSSPAMTMARDRAKALIEKANAAAPAVRDAVTRSATAHGGTMERLDTEIKEEDSLTRKIHDRAVESGKITAKTFDKVAAKIDDVLRYTVVIEDHTLYMDSHRQLRADLEAAGYTYLKEGNAWAEPEKFGGGYRGINMKFQTKDGQVFEIQFHTRESLALAEELHPLYEEMRDPATSPERKHELNLEMRRRAAELQIPEGALEKMPKP